MRKLASLIAVSLLIGCGGGGGGGGESPTTPANPEAVTAIAPQTGSPVISGFDLQFKEGDWWLYNYEDRYTSSHPNPITGLPSSTTTTLTGTARITLGSPKTILGITFFKVTTQYTGDVDNYYYIDWQYVASFDNKIYGCKDDQVFLIFDAHNGAWVGGALFGGITYDGNKARVYNLAAYKDMYGVVTPGMYYARYPEPNSFSLHYKEDYFTQGVGPSGYYEYDFWNSTITEGGQTRWTHKFTLAGSNRIAIIEPPPPPPPPAVIGFEASDFSNKTVYLVTSTLYEGIDFFADGTLRDYPINDNNLFYIDANWSIANGGRLSLWATGRNFVYYTLVSDDPVERYWTVSRAEVSTPTTIMGMFYDQATGLQQAKDFVANHRTP